MSDPADPLVRLRGVAVEPLWRDLDLDIRPGEFLTVLGPNGVGKSTLLRVLRGDLRPTRGEVRGRPRIGVIPQQRMFPPDLPLRGRDLVSLAAAHGVLRRRRPPAGRVAKLLAEVGATGLADLPVGRLSGGQQQLLRQAQAIADDPQLILADEPLLSLDPAAQRRAVDLLQARRREHDTAIVLVTHGINPVLRVTDRVLYLTPRSHVVGPVDEVMTSETLSSLYGSPVTVAEVAGRLVVV